MIASGRRSGKTIACAAEFVREALTNPDKVLWWVAPFYTQTEIAMRLVMRFLPQQEVERVRDGGKVIHLRNKTVLYFKTADNPDALRGEGVWFLVIDEASMIKESIWNDVLRPTLADAVAQGGGRVVLISTPRGINWFHDLFKDGQDPANHAYIQSWRFTTYDNKYIPREEIENAKLKLPALSFAQEWMSEFLSDVGAVFRNIEGCIKLSGTYNGLLPYEIMPPNDNEYYHIGVDLAKHSDFTVIIVLDSQGRLVYFDRFNQLDWVFQMNRIKTVTEKYKRGNIIIDATGIGDPIVETLAKAMGATVTWA